MSQPELSEPTIWTFARMAGLVIILWLGSLAFLYHAFDGWEERGQFGDLFGAVNALFSGLAFAGIYFTLLLQRRELALQRHAFDVQSTELARQKASTRANAGNLALLTLFQMFNAQRQFQKEVIATAPNDRSRWLRMKVVYPQRARAGPFDVASLAFLFEAKDLNLLPELLQEEHRYDIAIELINRRAHLSFEKIRPLLSQADPDGTGFASPEALEAAVGLALLEEARQLAGAIVNNVNENVESIPKLFGRLRATLKKLEPNEKFIEVVFDLPTAKKQ